MPSVQARSPHLDDLLLTHVNHFDIWDPRESAVGNSHLWRAACDVYKGTLEFQAGIPHLIHQIWIGTRQPPCVWLDTWRIDYMRAFQQPPHPDAPTWQYRLWDNEAVRDMCMLNRALYDAESAPQCQADILRLEVLYEYGGVYIDADIVSTVKDMRPALEEARDTGFLITYEPDTSSKPYSVLGNSLIACTPRHPLILMLMSYIKQIYPHKRPHHGVEWVTGPLTYTKVLIHPKMPVTVPPSKLFYPAFHYVPNPSAIDVTSFDSYCFQFGYTCSGLSQWVAENNKCRHAHDCSYHASIEYPLGKLQPFPTKILPSSLDAAIIPKTLHQFAFQAASAQPNRWMKTWRDDFCPANDFKYELWTWERLKKDIGSFFCASLYEENCLDLFAVNMLALEVLEKFGGYYVPLTTVFTGDASDPDIPGRIFCTAEQPSYKSGSIVGYAQGACIARIQESYNSGRMIPFEENVKELAQDSVSDMCYGDDVASLANFKTTSRFLGASEIYFVPTGPAAMKHTAAASAALLWAYDCQVPIFKFSEENEALKRLAGSEKRTVVITDPALTEHPALVDEIPGVIYRLDGERTEWDAVILNVEWEADENGLAVYPASSPFRAPNARYLGFIANAAATKAVTSLNTESLLEQHASERIYVASLKSRHRANVASIFRAMPAITHVFQSLAGHQPNFARDDEEVLDNLVKGFRDGRIGFELQVDNENRVMYRSWGDSGGIDCECKVTPGVNGTAVEWLRVYEDQVVAYETNGTFVR